MQGLKLENVSKSFDNVTAVSDVTLSFKKGDLVCFLGPSGCGKTTLLRMIAGLEVPSAGDIYFDDRNMSKISVHQRNIGMVFQSFALFPHLNVQDNIAYPLRIRGQSKAICEARVNELLELVRLPGVAKRRVSQLSGGQRQRVAIARALAINPEVFLLDEPMSALDAKLREQMQIELRRMQQELGITTIVVTHDQKEAMTMADQVVVLGDSKVQQVGVPSEIYHSPSNRFVADFIGASNLLPAIIIGEGSVKLLGQPLAYTQGTVAQPIGTEVLLMTRPENVIVRTDSSNCCNTLPGTVNFVRDLGSSVEILVNCGDHQITALSAPRDRPAVSVGDKVRVELDPSVCRVLAN